MINAGCSKLLPDYGEVPLGFGDVWEYHLCTDRLPLPKERIAVKELSDAYIIGKNEGSDPLNIPPAYREEE